MHRKDWDTKISECEGLLNSGIAKNIFKGLKFYNNRF